MTVAAVRNYQSAHSIEALGAVGPATRAALNGGVQTMATASDGYIFDNFLTIGSSNRDVSELQKRLTALGVYAGPITGFFGAQTRTAVMRFQAAHGIVQIGYVGPSTRSALNQ